MFSSFERTRFGVYFFTSVLVSFGDNFPVDFSSFGDIIVSEAFRRNVNFGFSPYESYMSCVALFIFVTS